MPHKPLFQYVRTKSLTETEFAARLEMISLVKSVATGRSFAAAGREFGLAGTSVEDRIGKFIQLVKATERWGEKPTVGNTLRLSLQVLCRFHGGLLLHAAAKLEEEMQTQSLMTWRMPVPQIHDTFPLVRQAVTQSPVWTDQMDARLGLASDAKLAMELGTVHRHVRARRLALGIPAFGHQATHRCSPDSYHTLQSSSPANADSIEARMSA